MSYNRSQETPCIHPKKSTWGKPDNNCHGMNGEVWHSKTTTVSNNNIVKFKTTFQPYILTVTTHINMNNENISVIKVKDFNFLYLE